MKQIWQKLRIQTNEPEFVSDQLSSSEKVRNVEIDGNAVKYEQLTWSEEDGQHATETAI